MEQQQEVMNGVGSPSKKDAPKRHAATGIVASKIDGKLVRKSARALGVAFDEEWTDEQVAVALYSYFKKNSPGGMYDCELALGGCGGAAPDPDGDCPFCGMKPPSDEEEKEESAEASDAAPDGGNSGSFDDGEEDEEPAESVSAKTPAPTTPVKARPRGAAKEKAVPKDRASSRGARAEKPSTALAKVEPAAEVVHDDTTPASKVQTGATLDEAVKAFRAAQSASFVAWWHEGRALWHIFENKLWMLRIDKATKAPAYKTFHQFLDAEIKITANLVFRKMDAARAYTESNAAKLGMTNCVLLMQTSPEAAAHIEAKIHRGELKTNKDVRDAVSKENKEKGAVKTKGAKSGERKTGAGRKKEFVKVAIAEQLGRSTLAFYATSEAGEKPERIREIPAAVAKWFAQVQPYAEHESLDGEVSEIFTFSVKDGFKLQVHRVRASGEE